MIRRFTNGAQMVTISVAQNDPADPKRGGYIVSACEAGGHTHRAYGKNRKSMKTVAKDLANWSEYQMTSRGFVEVAEV